MIQLTDKFFAVPVPEEAYSFQETCGHITYKNKFGNQENTCVTEKIDFYFSILGSVSKDTIDFDVAPYIPVGQGMLNSIYYFRWLMKEKGCNPDEKHLIIENI